MYSSTSSDDEDEEEQEDQDEPEVLVVEQYVQRVLVSVRSGGTMPALHYGRSSFSSEPLRLLYTF